MNALVWSLTVIAWCLTLTPTRCEEDQKDIEPDDEDALQLLNIIKKSREPKAFHKVSETAFGSLVTYSSWNDCGSSSDVAHIKSFSLTPDPLRLPGNITVAFQWQTTADLKSPITMDLKFEKKIGFIWITIPCDMIPGSCHHVNICEDLAPLTCPTQYQTCHCPFKQGIYTMNPTVISIPRGGVPSGDYRLTAWMKQAGSEIGCVHVELAVA